MNTRAFGINMTRCDLAYPRRVGYRRIRDAWATVYTDLPLSDEQRARIEQYWRRIPLAYEVR